MVHIKCGLIDGNSMIQHRGMQREGPLASWAERSVKSHSETAANLHIALHLLSLKADSHQEYCRQKARAVGTSGRTRIHLGKEERAMRSRCVVLSTKLLF